MERHEEHHEETLLKKKKKFLVVSQAYRAGEERDKKKDESGWICGWHKALPVQEGDRPLLNELLILFCGAAIEDQTVIH